MDVKPLITTLNLLMYNFIFLKRQLNQICLTKVAHFLFKDDQVVHLDF